jgi:hypothetical protein
MSVQSVNIDKALEARLELEAITTGLDETQYPTVVTTATRAISAIDNAIREQDDAQEHLQTASNRVAELQRLTIDGPMNAYAERAEPHLNKVLC